MGTILGVYCGKKTGQNLLVTGDKVKMTFRADKFLLWFHKPRLHRPYGFHTVRGTIKKLIKLIKFTKFIWRALLKISKILLISKTKTGTRDSNFEYAKTDFAILITKTKKKTLSHCHEIVASVATDSRILVNPITGLMDFLSEVSFDRWGIGEEGVVVFEACTP